MGIGVLTLSLCCHRVQISALSFGDIEQLVGPIIVSGHGCQEGMPQCRCRRQAARRVHAQHAVDEVEGLVHSCDVLHRLLWRWVRLVRRVQVWVEAKDQSCEAVRRAVDCGYVADDRAVCR